MSVAAAMQQEVAAAAAMPQAPWTENNVGVDSVATEEELSPELSEQLLQMFGGQPDSAGEVTFGESDDASQSIESMLGLGQAPGNATCGQILRQTPGQS